MCQLENLSKMGFDTRRKTHNYTIRKLWIKQAYEQLQAENLLHSLLRTSLVRAYRTTSTEHGGYVTNLDATPPTKAL